jgi:U1 small nuclear ribonucleoprotein
VGRLSYDITDKKLKREMEQYGPVKTVKLVTDRDGKSRGYAFVEFEKEEDMTAAFKRADGKKLEGRRIVVDVERSMYLAIQCSLDVRENNFRAVSRTVRNWRPRRLGGGLGGRKAIKSKKTLAEEAKQAAAGSDRKPAAFGAAASRPGETNDGKYGPGSTSGSAPVSRPGLGSDNRERRADSRDRGRGSERDRERDRGDRRGDGSRSGYGDSKYGPNVSSGSSGQTFGSRGSAG